MKKILIVVGTRPNYIKVTQFKKIAKQFKNLEVYIVHTGQHYDKNMSSVFFEQFGLIPDYFLEVNHNSVCSQMGETMIKLEEVILKLQPNIILSIGDVNSTLAAAIVANKLNIKLGHIESGLRSGDRSMPEEINRILTDEITDFYFVTEQVGIDNLLKEGKSKDKIHFVGNTMIDTLVAFQKQIDASNIREELKLKGKKYILMTMHRPSNVDDPNNLLKMVNLIDKLQKEYIVVFPIHPRTKNRIKEQKQLKRFNDFPNLIELPPLDYFSFQHLIKYAHLVVSDSGGIQGETTFQHVPCFTIRDNTESLVTTKIGTNKLMQFDIDVILQQIKNLEIHKGKTPDLWDGLSSQRIMKIIDEEL